jgi:hypothetical protein
VGGIYLERLLLDDNLSTKEKVVRPIFSGQIITLEERIDVLKAVEGLDERFESFPQCPHGQLSHELPDHVVIGEIGATRIPAAHPRSAGASRHPISDAHRGRTGNFEFEAASGVYTELQCGSSIFMDVDYGRNLDHDGAPTQAFEPSRFVWATVMSRPAEDRAIVDAGLKALAFDSGPPLVNDEPAATYDRGSEEQGTSGATNRLARRQDPPRPWPLRPDREPLRLVRRYPQLSAASALRPLPGRFLLTASSNSGRLRRRARCIDAHLRPSVATP